MSLSSSIQVEVSSSNYDQYIMPSENQIQTMRKGGRFNQSTILTYSDGSEWVFLPNKGEERFCGFLYLQEAIKQAGLSKVKAAENKMAIHDKQIIYLSQYCGDKRLEWPDGFNEASSLAEIGFTDTVGLANLRKIDDVIYVFDTEKGSFANGVHEKINSFVHVHDAIRSTLEKRM